MLESFFGFFFLAKNYSCHFWHFPIIFASHSFLCFFIQFSRFLEFRYREPPAIASRRFRQPSFRSRENESICGAVMHFLACCRPIPRSPISPFDETVPRFGSGGSPLVGSNGLEPSTSRLSGVRSNHLSYEPILVAGLLSIGQTICFGFPLSHSATASSSFDVVCSRLASAARRGGDEQNRTVDPLLARQVLSQLSYAPVLGLCRLGKSTLLKILEDPQN